MSMNPRVDHTKRTQLVVDQLKKMLRRHPALLAKSAVEARLQAGAAQKATKKRKKQSTGSCPAAPGTCSLQSVLHTPKRQAASTRRVTVNIDGSRAEHPCSVMLKLTSRTTTLAQFQEDLRRVAASINKGTVPTALSGEFHILLIAADGTTITQPSHVAIDSLANGDVLQVVPAESTLQRFDSPSGLSARSLLHGISPDWAAQVQKLHDKPDKDLEFLMRRVAKSNGNPGETIVAYCQYATHSLDNYRAAHLAAENSANASLSPLNDNQSSPVQCSPNSPLLLR